MRGKIGLVIGLAAGYVLGSRAGRERYEQIKDQAEKLWNQEPVQKQVTKVTEFAKSSAAALPGTLWDGAVKVSKAATSKGTSGSEKVGDVKRAAQSSAEAVKDAAAEAAADASAATDSPSPAAPRPGV
jgi:gas vesicle protein